jgi:CO dehydrogenase/acetyl-CoA synthase beta subunit
MYDCIEEVRRVLGAIPEHARVSSSSSGSSSAPERFMRPQGKSRIVSQSETHVELGHPSVPSAALVLCTNNTSLINDGRILIVGSDLGHLERGRYPFAHVVLVGGADMKPEHLPKLRMALPAVGQLDGCMVRLMEEKIWTRVSSEAVQDGFSLQVWGEYLLQTIHDAAPAIESAEAIFVVDMHDQVKEIMQIAGRVNEKRREGLLEKARKRTGKDYECENPYDCDSCPDKPECDALKDVAQEVKRRNLQAATFSKGGK